MLTAFGVYGQTTDPAATTQSNVIRNEPNPAMNTKGRTADMFQTLIDNKVNRAEAVLTTGSATAYVAAENSTFALSNKPQIFLKFHTANSTTTPTVNVNSTGAKTVVNNDGTALIAGQLAPNSVHWLYYNGTTYQLAEGAGGSGGGGSVTIFTAGDASPLFTSSVANPTTAPALTFAVTSHTANTVLAGPTSGGAAAPTFRSIIATDLPTALTDGSTKGVASFSASDFNSTGGNITIDYTNGQEATASQKGFLTLADWTTFNGKGNAQTANPLSQFAATTSAQLRSVLSDETGTGIAYFVGGGLGTPSSGVATNITGLPLSTGVTGILDEDHGGTDTGTVSAGDVLYGAVGNNWQKLAIGSSGKFFKVSGTSPIWGTFVETDLAGFTDITTGNASTSQHGLLKKLDGNAAHYLDGTGAFTTPPSAASLTTTAVKTSNYSASAGDLIPTDATSSSFTVTLPTTPADKSQVAVKMIAVTAGTYTVTIATGGSDVFNKTGGSTTATLSILNQGMILQYTSSTGIWYVIADDLSLAQLDARYSQSRVFNVERYGAKHDGQRVYDGAITSGQAILTSSTNQFASTDAGKVIVVSGAGAAGVALRTTILSYQNAGQVTLAANASTTVTGKVVTWGTDDTAAIQSCLNDAFSAGGDVYAPRGIYIINGALQTSIDGTNPNSQLYFRSHQAVTAPFQLVRVRVIGETAFGLASYNSQSLTGTVFLSTLTTSSGTNPAVLGTVGLSGNYSDFNFDPIELINISIQVNTNGGASVPALSVVNFINVGTWILDNVLICIDSPIATSTDPTGSGRFGFIGGRINNNGPNILRGGMISGFEYGAIPGEHTTLELPEIIGNVYGLTVADAGYFISGYAVLHQNKVQLNVINATTLTLTSGSCFLDLVADVEGVIPAKWYSQTSVITDPGNLAFGTFKVVQSNSGGATSISPFTGALNLNKVHANSVIPVQMNQAGGLVTALSAGHSLSNGIIEANSGQASGTSDKFGLFQTSANQSNTSTAPVGAFQSGNSAIAGTEKRLFLKGIYTNGATNTGQWQDYLLNAGTLTNIDIVTPTRFALQSGVVFNVTANSYFGSATTAPTARAHFAAGTSTASTAPIKLTSGTVNTTAETGAMEYNGTDLLFTPVGTNRLTVFTGYFGQTTLVSGTKAVTTNGVGTGSFCIAGVVTPTGVTLTTGYQCACTSNTITIQANVAAGTINTADGSVVNYYVKP